MRIITWNCNRAFGRKAGELLALKPDVAILQECERDLEVPHGYKYIWTGALPKMGLGVLARDPDARPEQFDEKWTFFLPVTLPNLNLRVLGTWAFHRRASKVGPDRVGMIGPVLESLGSWLGEGRSLMAGDFNHNVRWDTPRGSNNFRSAVHQLRHLGLRSAYHESSLEGFGTEKAATHHFRRKQADPYHIDYCFLHHTLKCSNVQVLATPAWLALSDHMPLVVDTNDA
jgi:endonuclease/exonuclease/phosphatase family metal-dependent hydrolase